MSIPSSHTQPRVNRRTVICMTLATIALPHSVTGKSPRIVNQQPADMQIKLTFAGRDMVAGLDNNPSARDFYTMLPLELSIENYANNEKIAYLPRRLTEESSSAFSNEQPYDLCYYAPWGNLALFYAPYRYSSGLIRLGRINEGQDALHIKGKFPLFVMTL